MGERKLQGRSVDQLAERFAELVHLAERAPEAEAAGPRDEMQDIEEELKARGEDHHTDLLPLAMHSDETVRFEAIAATFRMMTGNSEVDAKLVQRVAIATNAPFLKRTSSAMHVPRMPREILETLTTEELVDRFVAIGLAQDEANVYGEINKFNRLFDQQVLVVLELKSRDGDQRQKLLALYDHPNLQVRLNAVNSTLALATVEARRVLQAVVDSKDVAYAGDAGMTLSALDRGLLKPAECDEDEVVAEQRMPVADMTDDQLSERFTVIALELEYIERMDEPVSEYIRLYDLMDEVKQELKSRSGDRRHALIALLDHDNAYVRLKAAIATLALAPERARAVLQALSDPNRYSEAADAREMMRALDDGSYVPN